MSFRYLFGKFRPATQVEGALIQLPLFPDLAPRTSPALAPIGDQKDIRYYSSRAKGVLNDPTTTGMGYWSVNPYVGCAFGCTYCYARYAHRYVVERTAGAAVGEAAGEAAGDDIRMMPPWLAFERRVFVKEEAPHLLQRALLGRGERLAPLLSGEEALVVGTATDPYQPAERRYRVTRGILEVLARHRGFTVVVITKSPLITRDVDLLSRIAERSSLSIHISLITMRRELARRLEPRAPTPESRLRAVTRLRAAGIEVGINVMPVLPGITDDPADLETLVRRVAHARASYVSACALRLRATARQRYLPFIATEFPHLAERYANAYAHGHHPGDRYRSGLRRHFEALCARVGIPFGYPDDDEEEGPASAGEPAAPAQTTLF